MAKNISILGSTGSIGVQALDVARNLNIKVHGLTANSNILKLKEQIIEFKPSLVSVSNEELAEKLRSEIMHLDTEVLYGIEGLKKVASINEVDTVVTSIVGIAGLIPTIQAIENGKNIALANKETLVTAGQIVMDKAKKHNVKIYPVDSEHSAVWQCLEDNNTQDIHKIILTASGGPFRGFKKEQLENVTKSQALKHPNWSMGSKITIDSATMMNKGLEVIEAKWLFDISLEKVDVIVHPQSIIHSMVEYNDGSIIAQLGSPDMRIPIQLALSYPKREKNNFPKLNLLELDKLTFEKPDLEAFPCLRLAYEAANIGGTMPVVLNSANEEAVSLFLNNEIGFMEIPRIIEKVMNRHTVNINPRLEDIIEVDIWSRIEVKSLI